MRLIGRLTRNSCVLMVGFAALPAFAEVSAKANLPPEGGTCAIRAVSDGYFSARSRVIHFPDDRELTVIGLNHGNRDLRGGTADRLSKATTAGETARIAASDPAALEDSREALRFLQKNRSQFTFVAAEAAPSTVETNLKSYAAIRARVRKLGPAAENAMTLAFGADFYFHLSDSKAPRLIGAEDAALGTAYLRALPALEKTTLELKRAKFDPDAAARLSDFLNSLAARYVTFRPESDDSLREARLKFTAQDFARIEPFLRARLDVMRAMKARDRHDVERLLAQKASGVLLIGSSHLDSIASLLRDACLSIGAK